MDASTAVAGFGYVMLIALTLTSNDWSVRNLGMTAWRRLHTAGINILMLYFFVAFSATNHAKIYGLYPRKGTIAVGSDADIALWDPKRKVTIRHELIHDGADYTPYEGLEVTGWPVLTMVRGKVVVEDGTLVGGKEHGTYLPRSKPPGAATIP